MSAIVRSLEEDLIIGEGSLGFASLGQLQGYAQETAERSNSARLFAVNDVEAAKRFGTRVFGAMTHISGEWIYNGDRDAVRVNLDILEHRLERAEDEYDFSVKMPRLVGKKTLDTIHHYLDERRSFLGLDVPAEK